MNTMPTIDARRTETFQHRLELFNPGVVWLDAQGRVSAFNDVALQILGPAGEQSLGVAQDRLFGIDVVQLHPAKSREKLRFLIQSRDAGGCPVRTDGPGARRVGGYEKREPLSCSKFSPTPGGIASEDSARVRPATKKTRSKHAR